MSDEKPDDSKPKLIALQIAGLKDTQHQSVQTRFEQFGEKVADLLCQLNEHNEPVFEANKTRATFTLKVEIVRVADDVKTFEVRHEITEKMPGVPGKTRSTHYHLSKGMTQRSTEVEQAPLFEQEPMREADESKEGEQSQ